MCEAIILHCIEDAQHCITNHMYKGRHLFSTHSSVDVFLKQVYDIECNCLSKYFKEKEFIFSRDSVLNRLDSIFSSLDKNISNQVNKHLKMELNYFKPLYSIFGKYHFTGYFFFLESLKKIYEGYNVKKLLVYDYNFNSFFDIDTEMLDLLKVCMNTRKWEVISYPKKSLPESHLLPPFFYQLRHLIKRPNQLFSKVWKKAVNKIKFQRLSKHKKTIMLFDNLYEVEFLKGALKKYNIIIQPNIGIVPIGFKLKPKFSDIKIDFQKFDFVFEKADPLVKFFLKEIQIDFSKHITDYMNQIYLLDEINQKYPISLGIWGNPPAKKIKVLAVEYLKQKNVKIIGVQHGSNYGIRYNSGFHFDSDYNRCNYFATYGFTKEILQKCNPDRKIDTKIIPLGKVKLINNNFRKKPIDILFPLTNSCSIFSIGLYRTFPHELTTRQIKLLEYLNSLKEKTVYIKPFAFSTYQNCSILPLLKKLKNLKVIDYMTLSEFLSYYSPKVILFEYPSTPLYEVLHLNLEIFLMNDTINQMEENALRKLTKRVYFSRDVSKIITMIDLFLKGKLPIKRDQSFYNDFVYKKNTKEKILSLIDSLI